MSVDYLIIGQGISGTLLSWFLHQEGKTFIMIDEDKQTTSSQVAAGTINPVTGRRYVATWMAETLHSFAQETYEAIGQHLHTQLIWPKKIIDFFPTPQMRNAFVERIQEGTAYLHPFPDQNHFNQYVHYEFGCGEISPAYSVNISLLLADWRHHLLQMNAFRKEHFDAGSLVVKEDGVQYGDLSAQKIIFCDGAAATQNPWFAMLPFSPNKGEALIVEIPDLPNGFIFKRGLNLAPLPVKDLFWLGSNYVWEWEDEHPTQAFYDQATTLLKNWLKLPYKILFHKAALRPATVERRPFVGLHPQHPAIGIFNGMGSKGSSLAPFFARQLVQHLLHGAPLTPEADVRRFSRILSK
jgi:glycine/D-amino acid oxidase-like deaminating enzyme